MIICSVERCNFEVVLQMDHLFGHAYGLYCNQCSVYFISLWTLHVCRKKAQNCYCDSKNCRGIIGGEKHTPLKCIISGRAGELTRSVGFWSFNSKALIKRERKSSQVFSLCTLVPRLTANLRWLATNWACSSFIASSSNLRRLASCLNTKVLVTCLWDTFSMHYHKKRIM